MSLEIRARIICDQCGDSIEGPVETSASYGMNSYWEARAEAKKRRWLTLPRHGKGKHLCQGCADGVRKVKGSTAKELKR